MTPSTAWARAREVLRRVSGMLRRHPLDRELQDELRLHLECSREELQRRGYTPSEARRAVRLRDGGIDQTMEALRDQRGLPALERLWADLRHACRALTHQPGFTAAVLGTLALGIAANAAIFTVVYAVLVHPLPYPDSDRLLDLDHAALARSSSTGTPMSLGLYHYYLERARTLDGVALYRTSEQTVTGSGDPERILAATATPSLAPVLRAQPALGRWFHPDDGLQGSPRVVVLSDGLWRRRYGGDRAVIGRAVMVQGLPTEVIGVMPPSFQFPEARVSVWLPETTVRRMVFDDFSYSGVARLRDGATVSSARQELTALLAGLPSAYPDDRAAVDLAQRARLASAARTLKEATVGRVSQALWILLGAAVVVLLVAWTNVATLLLVRADARHREVAIRRALGSGHSGIIRLFVAESALLSVGGGVIGLLMAWAAVRLLVSFAPATLPRLLEIQLRPVTIVFTLGVSLLAALVFGLVPFLRRMPSAGSLHESGRSNTSSVERHRVRRVLMMAQVALALVLLIACGLLVRSLQRLRAVDPGFNQTSTLVFGVGLPEREYAGRGPAVAAYHAILDRLSALPGVTGASASTCVPLTATCINFPSNLRVEGVPVQEGTIMPLVAFRAVAGDYVSTMGMRMMRGREIERRDVEQREAVALVNEALAAVFFPNQDPVGRRVARGTAPWMTIVGVVADTPIRQLTDTRPQLYMPMSISGRSEPPGLPMAGPNIGSMTYIIRTGIPPLDILPSVRQAVSQVDRNLALAQVGTLEQLSSEASASMAFTTLLLSVAASVALFLGVIGIYGVMSYIVSRRTVEIGVRLALGAAPASIVASIVRQGGIVTLSGIGVGLVVALAGGRIMGSLLYQVGPRDPLVMTATSVLLLAVALVAAWLPARRAARVNPLVCLRQE